jgi:hypothetical protein
MIHDEEGKRVIRRMLSNSIPVTQEHLDLYNKDIIANGQHPMQIGDRIFFIAEGQSPFLVLDLKED